MGEIFIKLPNKRDLSLHLKNPTQIFNPLFLVFPHMYMSHICVWHIEKRKKCMTFALFILNYITVIQLKALDNTPEILAIPILLSKLGIKQFPDRRFFFHQTLTADNVRPLTIPLSSNQHPV